MKRAIEARNFVVDFLRKEIIGPSPGFPAVQVDGEEILRPQDPPRYRYGAGILFPMKSERLRIDDPGDSGQDLDTTVGSSGEDESGGSGVSDASADERREEIPPETDLEVNLANEFLPSAMGLSGLVRMPASLYVCVNAARYLHDVLPGWERLTKDGRHEPQKGWWRRPVNSEQLEFNGDSLVAPRVVIEERPVLADGAETGLWVNVVSRPFSSTEPRVRLLTVSLVNRIEGGAHAARNEDCFFQSGIRVDCKDAACFLEYPERPEDDQSEEELSLELLYRHRRVYAVGHGCSADWKEDAPGSATQIWTEVMPAYEMKPVLAASIKNLKLSMLDLSKSEAARDLELCSSLADAYEKWISERADEVTSDGLLSDRLKTVAQRHLEACRACLGRIRAGIDHLRKDPTARLAFGLMNRAMLMQQIHYEISTKQSRKWIAQNGALQLEQRYIPPSHDDQKRVWRPFQLAFILMNIRAMAEPESAERAIVDLIWFPTGGGKTEAYLGLSAFTIFMRRLLNPEDGGTSVLMRYTLRLLTTQQFQRAASLICACEQIRLSDKYRLGAEPFRIGLWVGSEVTPNDNAQAVATLNELLRGAAENKFIILSCPWCGAEMGPVEVAGHTKCAGYHRQGHPSVVVFRCDDPDCEFSGASDLPLTVVDEQIYDLPPTLLIGTVDKFAMLPWRPEARRIFGIGTDSKPPDLIIQDELHLISGPLGSMVGLYETVIDEFCADPQNGSCIPSKIVASTATISRANEQIKTLYGRDAFLFPPQGLRAGHSFFAEENGDEVGRLYVGVLASALPSHVTAQVRVMSALLQAVKLVEAEDPAILDPYWTMMGYFNSLRELGHAATLVEADIREYLNAVWDRMGITADFGGAEAKAKRRFINRRIELTSRVPSSGIPGILKELYDEYKGQTSSDAVDVCFATNMIQVGLDVPRLSLMTVVGQPKTTSEYIQASSRVGRNEQRPGLVVTNFNPFKPRDRSHFEHFRAYHQSIYRYVEPTSVTPFAIPVRERALHALVVSLARFWGPDHLRDSPRVPPSPDLQARIRSIVNGRVAQVDPSEERRTAELLDELFARWERILPPKYGSFSPPTEEAQLMYPAGTQMHPHWHEQPWPTPTSMRNVDADCQAAPISMYPQV